MERSYRRRRTAAAVAGGAAAVVIVGAAVALVVRDRGGETVVADDPPVTTGATPDPATTLPVVVSPTPTVTPATDPSTDSTTSVPPESTDVATSTTAPGTTSPLAPGSVVPTAVGAPSDEVLPDPLMFAADGFERELVGRDLVVRSDPEVAIPLALDEAELWLLGVGPNGIAYLRAGDVPGTRFVAVPTTGPTTGAIHELIAPYEHDGPWLGFMTPDGIDPFSNGGDVGIAPYVDPDGRPLVDPVDPTFTWSVTYRFLDDGTGAVQPAVVDATTGLVYELPVSEPGREGQFDRAIRPLPDGRVTIGVLPDDGTAVVWALDPATATWTVHPFE